MSDHRWFYQRSWEYHETMKMGVRARVLDMLTAGAELARPVCGTMFLDQRIPTYSQRISELRAQGHIIQRVPCPYDHGHTSKVGTYLYVFPSQR